MRTIDDISTAFLSTCLQQTIERNMIENLPRDITEEDHLAIRDNVSQLSRAEIISELESLGMTFHFGD